MGSMIRLLCKTCEIDRSENVGMGMIGLGSELCACYNCRRYILKKLSHWNGKYHENNLKCPYCRKKIEPIDPANNCPVCDSEIEVEWIGMWD